MARCFPWLVLLILWTAVASAQHRTAYGAADSTLVEMQQVRRQFGLHVMPLSLINFYSRYRIGTFIAGARWIYVLDIEYGDERTIGLFDMDRPEETFYGLRPELRYVVRKSVDRLGRMDLAYVGLEVPLSYYETALENGTYGTRDRQERFDFDRALQTRRRGSIILKGGYVHYFGQHFFVDGYTGMGLGIRRIAYVEVENKRPAAQLATEEWGMSSDARRAGTSGILDLALGVRFGYAF